MVISEKGLAFIVGWESFKSKAYKDQAGIWTIGYGTIKYHDGSPIREGDKITKEEAEGYLLTETDGISSKLNVFLQIHLEQNEFDALASLAYNIGTQGLKSSTILRKLNTGYELIEEYFTRWDKITVDGKLVASVGLIRRRKSEWKLFSESDYKGNRL